MIKIFIEAKNVSTPEFNFLQFFITEQGFIPDDFQIIPLDGKDNLRLAANQFLQNSAEGGTNLIIFDADSNRNGGGYKKRKEELTKLLLELEINASLFLWPNNNDDGDFETMLDAIARKDLHSLFFECYNDYELCLGEKYLHPNLKGKLHTYISAMKLSKKQRDKIGSGYWLFNDDSLWNLNSDFLDNLKDFLYFNFTSSTYEP